VGATVCAETANGSAKAVAAARAVMNVFMMKGDREICNRIVALRQ
jgi:hypothetical protein